MNENMRSVKYAGELVSIKRTNQTLSITDCLHPVTDTDDEPFISVFSKKSIYFLSLLKTQEKQGASANIPLDDLFDIIENTRYANDAVLSSKAGKQNTACENSNDLKAYTVLTMGNYKGKSPAQLLLEAGNPQAMEDELLAHAAFLEKNLERYPGNKSGIDAIFEAIRLYEDGQLKADDTSFNNPGVIEIYTPPTKYWAKKHDEKGNTKCYSLRITCIPTNKYPYHIELTNFFAPVGHNSNGTTPIYADRMDKASKVSATFDLTKPEWNMILGKMVQNYRSAHMMFYSEMRTMDEMNGTQN